MCACVCVHMCTEFSKYKIKLLSSFCFSGYSHTPFSLLPASAGDDAGITWVSLGSGPGGSVQPRSPAPARAVLRAVWSSPFESLAPTPSPSETNSAIKQAPRRHEALTSTSQPATSPHPAPFVMLHKPLASSCAELSCVSAFLEHKPAG